tara:strand:- start:481 stop:1188 length:708 start_codon:yes stop_codon:yes gene_type:complete
MQKRVWEIDFLRAVAVIMMIIFHFAYNLNFIGGFDVAIHSGFWNYFRTLIAPTFLVLVGISLTLSYSKRHASWPFYLKRGSKIFLWGLAITLITWLFLSRGAVVFGILHLIGAAVILAYPFLRLSYLNVLIGILAILFGSWLRQFTINSYVLVWLGIRPSSFYTLDYFPIFPWFGAVLIGIALGNMLYRGGARRFRLPNLASLPVVKEMCFIGRHALVIYLVHFPVLAGLIYALT